MRTFLRLLLLCSVAASAHAATWSPYIGLGGQANIIGSYSRHHGPLGSDNAWRGYPGYGGQIECGLSLRSLRCLPRLPPQQRRVGHL